MRKTVEMYQKPNLWEVPEEWAGQEAYLIGGGPSLKGFNFQLLAGKNVIGCNDAVHLGPEIVHTLVFGDVSWWNKNKHILPKFTGRMVTNSPSVLPFRIPNLLKCKRQRDGIHKGSTLGWNYSTGALAINLAVSLGAAKIYLLGYDLARVGNASHWHNHNPKQIYDFSFRRFIDGFNTVAKNLPQGVQVFNVSNGTTRLTCFPIMSFEAFKEHLINKDFEFLNKAVA
jgi:hypothetical protein